MLSAGESTFTGLNHEAHEGSKITKDLRCLERRLATPWNGGGHRGP